ncbi:hypothetical protein A3Q56_06750 [Intoshia linei]|uniref:Uncharacterized protein n=1 Tax=Intoshia linei TaxID=1819745 RepID=A0A177AUM3_9BILA|nr:hypothetical protein A3Q56_06750 [Intoshia linei]
MDSKEFNSLNINKKVSEATFSDSTSVNNLRPSSSIGSRNSVIPSAYGVINFEKIIVVRKFKTKFYNRIKSNGDTFSRITCIAKSIEGVQQRIKMYRPSLVELPLNLSKDNNLNLATNGNFRRGSKCLHRESIASSYRTTHIYLSWKGINSNSAVWKIMVFGAIEFNKTHIIQQMLNSYYNIHSSNSDDIEYGSEIIISVIHDNVEDTIIFCFYEICNEYLFNELSGFNAILFMVGLNNFDSISYIKNVLESIYKDLKHNIPKIIVGEIDPKQKNLLSIDGTNLAIKYNAKFVQVDCEKQNTIDALLVGCVLQCRVHSNNLEIIQKSKLHMLKLQFQSFTYFIYNLYASMTYNEIQKKTHSDKYVKKVTSKLDYENLQIP